MNNRPLCRSVFALSRETGGGGCGSGRHCSAAGPWLGRGRTLIVLVAGQGALSREAPATPAGGAAPGPCVKIYVCPQDGRLGTVVAWF